MDKETFREAILGILAENRDSIPFGVWPMCNECKHFHRGTAHCDAFPKRIPKDILCGGDHTKPYPGDNGITFEPIDTDK